MRRLFLPLLLLGAVGWSVAHHPLAWRFATGTWPVPSGTPWTYQLESGFVPALTVLTLLGSVLSLYHLHNCHKDGCWRIGKHKINGTPWCSRHQAQARPEKTVTELLERVIELLEQRS